MSRGRRRDISYIDSDYEADMAAERRRGISPSPSAEAHTRIAKKPRAGRTTSEGTSEEDERRRRRLLANRRSAQRSRVKRLEEVGVLENLVDTLMKEVEELRTELGTWTSRQQELLSEQSKLAERLREETGVQDIDVLCIAHIEGKEQQQQQQQQELQEQQDLQELQGQQQQQQQQAPGSQHSPDQQHHQPQQPMPSPSPPPKPSASPPPPPQLPPRSPPPKMLAQPGELLQALSVPRKLQERSMMQPQQLLQPSSSDADQHMQHSPTAPPPQQPPQAQGRRGQDPPPQEQHQQRQQRCSRTGPCTTALNIGSGAHRPAQPPSHQPEASEEVAMECISPGRLLEICTTPLHELDNHPNHLSPLEAQGQVADMQRLVAVSGPGSGGSGGGGGDGSGMACRESGTGEAGDSCGRGSGGGGAAAAATTAAAAAAATTTAAAATASRVSRTQCPGPFLGAARQEPPNDVEAGSGTSSCSPLAGRPVLSDPPRTPSTAALYGTDGASQLAGISMPYQAEASHGLLGRDAPLPPSARQRQQQQQQMLCGMQPDMQTGIQQHVGGAQPSTTHPALSSSMLSHRVPNLEFRSGSGSASGSGGGACQTVPYNPTSAAVSAATTSHVAMAPLTATAEPPPSAAAARCDPRDASVGAGGSQQQLLMRPTCSGQGVARGPSGGGDGGGASLLNPDVSHIQHHLGQPRVGEGFLNASTASHGWDNLDAASPLSYGSKEPPLPPAAAPAAGSGTQSSPAVRYGGHAVGHAARRGSGGGGGGGGAVPPPLHVPVGSLLEAHFHLHHPHTAAPPPSAASRPRAVGVPPPRHAFVSTAAVTTNSAAAADAAAAGRSALPAAAPPSSLPYNPAQQGATATATASHAPRGSSGGGTVSSGGGTMPYHGPPTDGMAPMMLERRPGDALSAGGAAAGSLAAAAAAQPPPAGLLPHAMSFPGAVATRGPPKPGAIHPTGSADSTSSNSSNRRRSVSSDSERSLTYAQREAQLRPPLPLPPKQEPPPAGPPPLHPHGMASYPDLTQHGALAGYPGSEGGRLFLDGWDLL